MEMRYEDCRGTELNYRVTGDTITITNCMTKSVKADIPMLIEQKKVTRIAKKTFLGCKLLTKVRLPETIQEVGEWAFAFCDHLEEVQLPEKSIVFGQGCFDKCIRLKKLSVYAVDQPEQIDEEQAALLASTVRLLDADYLLDPLNCKNEAWLREYDLRLMTLLAQEDMEGFQKEILCGEEDLNANQDDFLSNRRRYKASLCYFRLFHRVGLSDENQHILEDYLKEHQKGCPDEAAWEYVLMKHGDEKAYYELLLELDCINQSNLEAILDDMGDRHPQMKAFLLQEQQPADDFFSSLLF